MNEGIFDYKYKNKKNSILKRVMGINKYSINVYISLDVCICI